MKKVFYLAAAAMAVLSSCDKDNMLVENGAGSETINAPVFTATIEDHATKTTLGEGNKVNWENGDEVLMALGIEDEGASAVYIYEATPGVDASSATLSYKADVMVLDPNADKLVMAIYPASILSLGKGYIFPATQTYNGEDISFAPMFSMPSFLDPETPNNIVFKNGAALLKITVPHTQMTNLTSITVSSDLVMNGKISFDEDGYMYIVGYTDVTSENSKITLNIPSGIAIPEGESKTFYIAIPPMSEQTQEAQADHYGYLQIDVTDGTTTKSMRTNKAGGIQVERNKIYPITFEENVAPAAWETALTLGRSSSGATSIVIETGIDVSSYTEDETHKPLNAAGTLWEVLDGEVLRIQTSSNKIIAPVYSSSLFENYSKVESITGLDKLDMSAVTNIECLFANCRELKSLNLSSFNTSNVTDMYSMFVLCNNLTEIIGIEHLNTSNVTNMSGMFSGCSGLSALDISNFVTSSVENMSGMFNNCGALQELDLSNFNTENVTDMSGMFSGCLALQTLNLSSFNTENVTDMSGMFTGCQALQTLDLSSFHTMNAPDMSYMFYMCTSLESLYLGDSFMMGSDMNGMFSGCGSDSDSELWVYGADPMFVGIVTNDPATGWNSDHMHFEGY